MIIGGLVLIWWQSWWFAKSTTHRDTRSCKLAGKVHSGIDSLT